MDSTFGEYASSSTRKGDSTFKEGEMTREEIIQMAREAGFRVNTTESLLEELERFAALVASAERSACAKVCESIGQHNIINQCTTAIRARGSHD